MAYSVESKNRGPRCIMRVKELTLHEKRKMQVWQNFQEEVKAHSLASVFNPSVQE